MNLEVFFLELITRLNELSAHDKRHHRSFGFQSNGSYIKLVKDLQVLIRNYRHPHPNDRESNRKTWEDFVRKEKELGLGILDAYRYNVKLRTALRKFLTEGAPQRMV